jgi:hypothetical protein
VDCALAAGNSDPDLTGALFSSWLYLIAEPGSHGITNVDSDQGVAKMGDVACKVKMSLRQEMTRL